MIENCGHHQSPIRANLIVFEMDQGLGSTETFIKKKSLSGCLIIKKKIIPSGGAGPLPRKAFGSNETRARLERPNFSHSVSGLNEKTDRFINAEGILGNNRFGRSGEFGNERRRKFDDVAFNENTGMYRKRIRSDDSEVRYRNDENRDRPYFEMGSADGAHLSISPLRQKFRVTSDKPIRVQGKNGVLKVMLNKSKNVNLLRKFYEKYIEDGDRDVDVNTNLSMGTSLFSNQEPNLQNYSYMRAYAGDSETDGYDFSAIPKSKSVINRKKDMNMIRRSYENQDRDFVGTCSNLEMNMNRKAPVMPAAFLVSKVSKTGNSLHKEEKSDVNLRKSLSLRAKKDKLDSENSDSSTKQEPEILEKTTFVRGKDEKVKRGSASEKQLFPEKSDINLPNSLSSEQEPRIEQVGSSSKGVKGEEAPSVEKAVSGRFTETKVKRGTGTEKQLLREKIRHKLVSSGWTINYRPRKNRDYLDAVYINPAGTAYWSIIKAYEAFKKQVGEEDVPEELLNKLTRQTRKKMEKEMKMKKLEEAKNISRGIVIEEAEDGTENDDNDEKLSFFKKHNGSSLKKKAEKKPPTNTNSRMMQELKMKDREEAKDDTGNDDNDEKLSFLRKKLNAKPLKPKVEKPLLVRSTDKSSKAQDDGYVPHMGKRTVLSWLIDSGIVHESEKVQYMNRKQTKIMCKGWVSREGIHCGCCNKIVTVSKFEIHAGSNLRQPFQNIYLESGKSLLMCQVEAWHRQDEAKRCGFYDLNIDGDDGNDDVCGLCGDGGDLMCCDGCPSTFHQSCMGIQALPFGDWHCPNCMCKICEKSGARGNALLTCIMCERKYHKACKEDIYDLCADVHRESASFCGKTCQEVYDQLQKLLEVKHELESGFSWSLIHRTDIDTDVSQHEFSQKVECNSKLAVALSVIEECFLPIKDRRSGINLIHNIVYNRGSNYSRLNHSGFYTAILERGDEIIAAASIRIHGTQLAEMPFIGTRHMYRRHGMCRMLLRAIESVLLSLKVEKLVIPAIGEHMPTWTQVFGFKPLEKSQKKQMRCLKMFVFPRTEMLQKKLVEQNTIQEHSPPESGAVLNLTKKGADKALEESDSEETDEDDN